jgi:hypothetical protein
MEAIISAPRCEYKKTFDRYTACHLPTMLKLGGQLLREGSLDGQVSLSAVAVF